MSVNNSEQWLTDGLCTLCRKYNYCSKKCSARIRRENLEIERYIQFTALKLAQKVFIKDDN